MKFCDDHWSKLRAAVDAAGMTHLTAPDATECARRMQAGEFEPLMQAHMMIVHRIVSLGGTEMMLPDEDGNNRCPVCEALKVPHRYTLEDGSLSDPYPVAEVERHYIEGPVEALLSRARDSGLMPPLH